MAVHVMHVRHRKSTARENARDDAFICTGNLRWP